MEIIIGALGLILAAATYFVGVRRGEKHERELRQHEIQLQASQRLRDLASRAADEYIQMARTNYEAGPHALATLNLDLLGSTSLIEEAIHEMHLRSGADPWGGASSHVAGLDLVAFFRYVRQRRIDFSRPENTIEEIARRMRNAASRPPDTDGSAES